MLLNSIFLFLTRFNPSRKTITHTAEPRVAFIITISVSVIPSKDTSIERCNANIETKASANDMFRSAISVADVLRRAFMSFIVASVILVKAYAAIAIITIICRSCPLSRNTESITVPESGMDSSINIHPVNLAMKCSLDVERSTAKRTVLKIK